MLKVRKTTFKAKFLLWEHEEEFLCVTKGEKHFAWKKRARGPARYTIDFEKSSAKCSRTFEPNRLARKIQRSQNPRATDSTKPTISKTSPGRHLIQAGFKSCQCCCLYLSKHMFPRYFDKQKVCRTSSLVRSPYWFFKMMTNEVLNSMR